MLTFENIVVYRFSTLRLHSKRYTPYFRDLPSKKDTQSFFSVAYRPRSSVGERTDIKRDVADTSITKRANKKAGRMTCFFIGSPCWARTSDIMKIKCFATLNCKFVLRSMTAFCKQKRQTLPVTALRAVTVKFRYRWLKSNKGKQNETEPHWTPFRFGSPCWARTSDPLI